MFDDSELETFDADLVPGSALRWPPCECGNPDVCPDHPASGALTEELRSRPVDHHGNRRKGER